MAKKIVEKVREKVENTEKEFVPWKDAKLSLDLWNTVLLWSGYDYYHTIDEIAKLLQVSRNTIRLRLRRFQELYPEAFEKLAEDRETIRHATTRLDRALDAPVAYDSGYDEFIREVF